LIGLGGRPRIGWFLQALMGGHGPKDVLPKL
jgi:hypothetical protein